ncbi:hypothetical protein [Caulobacter sp. FWC2]|uniref:hypothetical protein n=1 Tax=Caulobacter sp. FWC2 TaxID=69664 RepID=UPI000C14DBB4|nr:hypothetical protein [Caulobacter sp. FWC2]PIB90988.1 hypothetical protein CSW62_05030 [Caulobacter sp. FWC2]
MIVLIYKPDGTQLISGDEFNVQLNMPLFEGKPDTYIRVLDDTPLSDVGSVIDSRIPATVEEFDELYGSPET